MMTLNAHRAIAGRRPDFQEDGFTIVEMLVALCITALLSSLLAVAILQLRPMQRATDANEADTEIGATAVYLQRLLSNARPLALIGDDPNEKLVFVAERSSMRFVSLARVESDRSSLRDIEIVTRSRDDGIDLIQRNRPRRMPSDTPIEEFTISAGLSSVEFQFLTSPGRTTEPEWLDRWTDKEALPSAVRIKLSAGRFSDETIIEWIAAIPAGK
ncbi:hypothetical protein ABK249_33275 [Neorhizobium sp. Rsf11]|uniref:Type II secretion system protein J n=1 Tax=Neorhizobium phenanthreniclasticum TaxID=3157917 RepID=A0ABV0ME87_9HYPH